MIKYYRYEPNERYRMFAGYSNEKCNGIPDEVRPLLDEEVHEGKPITHLWQPFPFKFAEQRWYRGAWHEDKSKYSDFPYLCNMRCPQKTGQVYIG